jgi:hypothetical protein
VHHPDTPIAAQVRAQLALPATATGAREPAWDRALTDEMERTLVSGYACAMTVESECLTLERTVHALAAGLRSSMSAVGELRRVERELEQRRTQREELRELLRELRDQVAQRRARLDGPAARAERATVTAPATVPTWSGAPSASPPRP